MKTEKIAKLFRPWNFSWPTFSLISPVFCYNIAKNFHSKWKIIRKIWLKLKDFFLFIFWNVSMMRIVIFCERTKHTFLDETQKSKRDGDIPTDFGCIEMFFCFGCRCSAIPEIPLNTSRCWWCLCITSKKKIEDENVYWKRHGIALSWLLQWCLTLKTPAFGAKGVSSPPENHRLHG